MLQWLLRAGQSARKPKIVWYEPRWAYVPSLWRSWKQASAPASILRVTFLTAVAVVVIVGCAKVAIPQLQIGFVWKAALALPGLYLYMFCMVAIYAAVPPRVELRADRIFVQHGQQNVIIFSRAMKRARLVVFSEDRVRLTIWYSCRFWNQERRCTKKFGVGHNVNLENLVETLPTSTTVWDLRARVESRRLRTAQATTA